MINSTKIILVFVITSFLIMPAAVAQQKDASSGKLNPEEVKDSSVDQLREINQQDAFAVLLRLSTELKSENDRPTAATLQAQVADLLWNIDEQRARTMFRQAFDALRQPDQSLTANDKTKIETAKRRATALNEVLRLLGIHDKKSAESWLKELEEENKGQAAQPNSPEQAELLAQIALQVVTVNPEQSFRLGIRALSGGKVPDAILPLLSKLRQKDKKLSDSLFESIILALRRGGYTNNLILSPLSNYLFDAQGKLFSNLDATGARIFIDYLIDAAKAQAKLQRETGSVRGMPGTEPDAGLYTFLVARAMPIFRLNAPDKLQYVQSLLDDISYGLTQQQLRDAATLATSVQQSPATSQDTLSQDIDALIQRAEREKDSETRDNLWRIIASKLMRGDPEKALTIAAKIDNLSVRALTEDDIRLIIVAEKLRSKLYDEAQAAALKFNDIGLKAKTLAQIADKVFISSKDIPRATELLSEAFSIASKGDNNLDKVQVLLIIAEKFSKFDLSRGFDVLSSATKVANQMPLDNKPQSLSTKGGNLGIRVKSYTMVGGMELTTGEHATVESIDFDYAGAFAKLDYNQTRSIGESIQSRLLRTKFFISVANALKASKEEEKRNKVKADSGGE